MSLKYAYHGIAVYEIIDNGRILSGISANNSLSPTLILSDIAIKQGGQSLDTLSGKYDACVMDVENNKEVVVRCELTITLRPDNTYNFVWRDRWEGIGFKSGNNHVSVSYSHPL